MGIFEWIFNGGQFVKKTDWKHCIDLAARFSTQHLGQYRKSTLWNKRRLSLQIQPWVFAHVCIYSKVREGLLFQEYHKNMNSSWKQQIWTEPFGCNDWWPPLSYNQWEGWLRVTSSLGTWTGGRSAGKEVHTLQDNVWQLTNHAVVFLWHRTRPNGTAC